MVDILNVNTCADTAAGGIWTSAGSPIGRTVGQIPFFMVDILVDSPVYFIGADRQINYLSNTYSPFPFQVEQVRNVVGPAPLAVRIATSNIDRNVAAIVLGENVQGKEVIIRKAYWTQADPSVCTSPYVFFSGLIDTVSIKEEENTASVEFEIKNDFVRWDTQLPRNTFSANCNWIFKSTTPGCQYTGAASLCDKSYERCTVLGNTDRFRGFRHMTKLEDYVVWWGRGRGSSEGADLG